MKPDPNGNDCFFKIIENWLIIDAQIVFIWIAQRSKQFEEDTHQDAILETIPVYRNLNKLATKIS